MSLTSHLDNPNSPVRLFLEESFPIISGTKRGSPLAKELSSFLGFDKLPECQLPTLAPKNNQGTIGTAVDYRFRYCFGAYSASDTVAAHGLNMLNGNAARVSRMFLEYHDALVTRLNPAALHLDERDEAALDASCVVLAWFEQILRTGMVFPDLGSLLEKAQSNQDVISSVPIGIVQDIGRLTRAFEEDAGGLLKPNPIFNPTFSGSRDVSGADADIIVDRALVDFKCTSKIEARKLREAVLQLLGYVLLDYDAEYDIAEIMIYLPRQRCSWHLPLSHLLLPPAGVVLALTRGTMDGLESEAKERLQSLRAEFRKIARTLR